MNHLVLCLLCVVASQSFCYAEVTKLSANDRKMLQDSSRFREVHSTTDLPRSIIALCGDEVAEPGQNWNATDVVTDRTLPAKRLIWAAIAGDYYVVHYERGGVAHTYHILVAKLEKGGTKAEIMWQAMGGPFKDYAGFVDALRNEKLDDRLDWH